MVRTRFFISKIFLLLFLFFDDDDDDDDVIIIMIIIMIVEYITIVSILAINIITILLSL